MLAGCWLCRRHFEGTGDWHIWALLAVPAACTTSTARSHSPHSSTLAPTAASRCITTLPAPATHLAAGWWPGAGASSCATVGAAASAASLLWSGSASGGSAALALGTGSTWAGLPAGPPELRTRPRRDLRAVNLRRAAKGAGCCVSGRACALVGGGRTGDASVLIDMQCCNL